MSIRPAERPARRAGRAAVLAAALAGGLLAAPGPLSAQSAEPAAGGDGYAIPSDVEAPRSETGRAYLSGPGRRLRAEPIYAEELEGDLAGKRRPPREEKEKKKDPPRDPLISLSGNMGGLFAILLILVLLGLALKFGAGGALLRGDPQTAARKRKAAAPEAWAAEAEDLSEAGDLLARLAAMGDRAAALAILLRHALLAAAEAAELRFARADTEREAFAKVPADWPGRPALAGLLRAAELAHYGGRPVSDADFAAALEAGRGLLGMGAGAGAGGGGGAGAQGGGR